METLAGKRVSCLYRVSTKSQVNLDTQDIPMQKNACRTFAKSKGWTIVQEYEELGISGFKKTAGQRDAIQQLLKCAERKAFDILLVFMFDRLGRRNEETLITAKLFNEHGIAIWSVKEGEQKLNSHMDELMAYLRFWQSYGESLKTSDRVLEAHRQMIREGKYLGGPPPYGYKVINSDRINKKGRILKDIVQQPYESQVVKLIFSLAEQKGYGGQRIARYLNENGYRTRSGVSPWGLAVVNSILRNPIYKGYPAYGKTSRKGMEKTRRQHPEKWIISDIRVEHLAIVQEQIWDRVQQIRTGRTPKQFRRENIDYDSKYPMQTKSPLLLTGILFCGHCGSTMCAYDSWSKWTTKAGDKRRKLIRAYRCTSVNRGIKCSGQTTYVHYKIEDPVLAAVYRYLENLAPVDFTSAVNQLQEKILKDEKKKYTYCHSRLSELRKKYNGLLDKYTAIMFEDNYSDIKYIKDALNKNRIETEEMQKALLKLESKMEIKAGAEEVLKNCTYMSDWRKEFDSAEPEIRKMIISELIEKVTYSRDEICILFQIDVNEFMGK